MTKLDDITKLLLEEITVLISVAKSILFFYLVLLNTSVFAASVKIDGFLNHSHLYLQNKYNFLFLNENNENGSQLILFKENGYSVVKHENGEFGKISNYSLNYSISNIKKIFDEGGETYYAAVARKNRTVLIINITKEGFIRIVDYVKYYTYPSEIDTYYNNLNGSYTILVSGLNFSGLGVLNVNKQGKIIDKLYIKNNTYKSAFLLDLNWDFTPDIIAFNSILNKIDFLYTNDGKNYLKERDFYFNQRCNNIKLRDLNNDKLPEIIASVKSGFQILYGDSVYSFNHTKKIELKIEPNIFTFGNINNIGNNEIIFTDKEFGSLKILFEDVNNNNKYQYVDYCSGSVLLFKFWEKDNEKKLFYLDNKKNINCISSITNLDEKTNICLPSISGSIGGDIPLNTLFFIDNNYLTLNLLYSNKQKFDYYYKCKISDVYDKIKLFNKSGNYCFAMTKGESNNLGYAFLNVTTGVFESSQIYMNEPIHDFSINTIDGEIILTIITKYKGKIKVYKYIINNIKTELTEVIPIDANVFDAKINNFNPNDIFYWKYIKESKKLIFNRYDIEKEKVFNISYLDMPNTESLKINSVLMRYDKQAVYAAILTNGLFNYNAIYNYKNGKIYLNKPDRKIDEEISSMAYENKLVWYNKFLFINNSKNGNFVKYDVSKPELKEYEKFDMSFITNYFMTFVNGKMVFAYKQNESTEINFKEIGSN